MKAKIINGIKISNTEMLAIGTEVEIVDGYCGCDGYYYTCKIPDGRQIHAKSDYLEITDFTPYIDWKARRYELAKAAMQGILGDEDEVNRACQGANYGNEVHTTPKAIAQYAIACADALIKELKGE